MDAFGGEMQGRCGPHIGFRGQVKAAAVQLSQGGGNGQTEAQAAMLPAGAVVQLGKRQPRPLQFLRAHPDAAVTDEQIKALATGKFDANLNFSPRGGKFDGIGQ